MCERCNDTPMVAERPDQPVLTEGESEEFDRLMGKFLAWRPFGVPVDSDGKLRWGPREKLEVLRLWDRLDGLDQTVIGELMSSEMAMENILLNSGMVPEVDSAFFKKAKSN